VNGVDRDRLVVHGPRPRLEAELGGATQVGISEHGVHLASLDTKRPGNDAELSYRLSASTGRVLEAVRAFMAEVPSGEFPVMLCILRSAPWGTLADG
jgi:hypothetical protein